MAAARRRVLLLMKPFDVYPTRPAAAGNGLERASAKANPKISSYLNDRCRVHKETLNLCQSVLQRKQLDWFPMFRDELSEPICNVDLVVTVGGDGTLLQASHFVDDVIPILGVNSDPTRPEEVDEMSNEFDATRSTGYLCASTAVNFEEVLDATLENCKRPSSLVRISVKLNGQQLPTYALNDILIAHPCPANVSRFSYRIQNGTVDGSRLVNCRSSGLRISTAIGSTAAMLSAGGFKMSAASHDLQYMVREPISPRLADAPWMHGVLEAKQQMLVVWYNQEGDVYFDGSHASHPIVHGDILEISSNAPTLKVILPPR